MEILTILILIIILAVMISLVKEHFIKKTARFIIKVTLILFMSFIIIFILYSLSTPNSLTETGAAVIEFIKTKITNINS